MSHACRTADLPLLCPALLPAWGDEDVGSVLTAGSGASWCCRYLRDSPAPRLAVPLRLAVPGGAGAVAVGRGGPRSPVHLSHTPRLPSQPFA